VIEPREVRTVSLPKVVEGSASASESAARIGADVFIRSRRLGGRRPVGGPSIQPYRSCSTTKNPENTKTHGSMPQELNHRRVRNLSPPGSRPCVLCVLCGCPAVASWLIPAAADWIPMNRPPVAASRQSAADSAFVERRRSAETPLHRLSWPREHQSVRRRRPPGSCGARESGVCRCRVPARTSQRWRSPPNSRGQFSSVQVMNTWPRPSRAPSSKGSRPHRRFASSSPMTSSINSTGARRAGRSRIPPGPS